MEDKYGIRIIHDIGPAGWVAGKDCNILLFKTRLEAEKALKQMKSDPHYLWKYEAEVKEFTGFRK